MIMDSDEKLSAISTDCSVATAESPIDFTGDICQLIPQKKRGSFSSITKSIVSSGIVDEEEIRKYTEENIQGNLTNAELDLRRERTINTIINKIVTRPEESDISNYAIEEDKLPIDHDGEEYTKIDPELITWGFDNPEDPRNWKLSRKISVIGLVSLYTLISPMSSSILSPAMKQLSAEFKITSELLQALVISIHILAWAIGPLVIAPLSEDDRLGRRTVLNVSCWLSLLFNIGCALSKNTTQIVILRFVSGLFSATPLNVSPAVVSDLFDAKNRNISLAGVFLIPFIGPAIAPIIGGYIAQAKGWRWVLYTLSIINGVIAIIGTIFYQETYSPALLKQKANKLRKATGNNNLHTIYEIADNETTFEKLKGTITRPIVLLFTHPMVAGLGSFMAFIYGFLYLMIVTFPSVFEGAYGFSQSTAGLMYISMGVGFVAGVGFWTYALGLVYDRLTERNGGVPKPEFRLPCLFVTAIIIPIGLLWYGWSVQKKLHWIMPCVGSGLFAFGLVCVFQTLQAYLIDMNPRFAASSIAAAAIFRFLFGFSFPLFAPAMYTRLHYGWANTMCAIIALLLGIPFPYLCYRYGERIREWANERLDRSHREREEKLKERLRKKQPSA